MIRALTIERDALVITPTSGPEHRVPARIEGDTLVLTYPLPESLPVRLADALRRWLDACGVAL